jgi:GNAT superfamily N-acetyltransferase
MAVTKEEQRKGHGRAAVALLAEVAISLKLDAIEVGAAADAVGFYQRNGFDLVDPARESPLLRLNLR